MKKKFHIGMRNLKTAIAVFLCMLLFFILSRLALLVPAGVSPFLNLLRLLLDRENPIYACVASVIVMQSTVEGSKKLGISRNIGTAFGGVFGLLFLWLDTVFFDRSFNMLFVCLGVVLLIALLNYFDRGQSVPIATVTFLIIMITIDEQQPYVYAVNRLIDTAIGVVISIAVNRLIKNPNKIHPSEEKDNGASSHEAKENN